MSFVTFLTTAPREAAAAPETGWNSPPEAGGASLATGAAMHDRRGLAKQSGFTLVEMMLVMALLGVLAAVAVPILLGAKERSRNAACDQAFHALDGEIANQIDLVTRSGANVSGCGDMGTSFPDLQIIRCVTRLHADETNPRAPEQPLYFNYIEDPVPFDSCQIGFDEDVASAGLAIKVRQYVSPGAPERTFTIVLE